MFQSLIRVKSKLNGNRIYNLTKYIHRTACDSESFKSDKKKSNKLDSSNNVDEDLLQTKTLEYGVIVKDVKLGTGTIAKPGKQINVFYTGYFQDNSKVFDSNTKGKGFKFNLGQGEVIKGWDVGVPGMKVGGKRVVTCPPNAAYGSRGAPPTIPANSTLVFEIELNAVK